MLHKNGIEFSLLTAGRSTTLVKDVTHEWNQYAKAMVYEAIQFTDDSSNVADAVLHATEICSKSTSSKAKKTMFVITDGYDDTPRKLRMSLSYAESVGIQTIGLGVGYFSDAIMSYFPNYVVVNNPKILPDGLRQFYCGEGTVDSTEKAIKYQIEEEKYVQHGGKTFSKLEEVWKENMAEVYKEEVEKTKHALYLAMSPARTAFNVMSIDLCFVMDTTGSMTPHIVSAKKYILKMTNDIKKNVEEKCGRQAKLRVGFVSYKVVGNTGHLQNQPFTENIAQVKSVLDTVRASGGRGHEDKYDGMSKAMSFTWESTARFLVLIGDVPGYENKTAEMPVLVGRIAATNIHLMYVSISSYTDNERNQFKAAYLKQAPPKMKSKGFLELDLKNTNDSDKLQDMITDNIDEVICSEFL